MSCDQLRREITILRDDLSFANQRAEDAKAELEIMHGFYLAALARAEAAEADADLRATERDSAIDRALSAEMQLEAAKAQLAALKAAGGGNE